MKTIFIALVSIWLISCSGEWDGNDYDKLMRTELASGKKVDSIFFGIHLGMRRKDFFLHCWEMNKKGLFTDGTGNMYVMYRPPIELKYPASMNFYPDFNDSTIWRMRVNFQYNGWAPWNKHLGADSLLPDVLALYKRWHKEGNDFLEIGDGIGGKMFVKIDGNRKIAISRQDDVIVRVDYIDLPIEKKLADAAAEK